MTAKSTSDHSHLSEHHAAAPQRLSKRSQVARACDGCRLRRIKCDNKVPCSKCSVKGLGCSNSGIAKALTLSEAYHEIEGLKQRVKQLEAQINQQGSNNNNNNNSLITKMLPDSRFTASDTPYTALKRFPDGIQFRPGRSPNEAWFGLSSIFFFVQRFSVSLNFKLSQSLPAYHLLPLSAKEDKLLDQPISGGDDGLDDLLHQQTSLMAENSASGIYLSLIEEEYFISFFWQTFHTSIFPILNETHFKNHYQSLWASSGTTRRPSALVDIVIAMCMQYYLCTLPSESQGILVEGKDAMVAGRWHYWRGQALLTYELESPSISTLQCQLLCAIYLCGGSFQNRMENSVSIAVRVAYTLGLHIDPPSTMPESDRELRRRLWWAVFLMDTKSGMKLGRPFMLHDSYVMPCLPSDSFETAAISGSTFTPIGKNATWLSFNLYHLTLYIEVRAAYVSFNETILCLQHENKTWDSPVSLQASAEALAVYIRRLHNWVDSVPEPLRMKRCDDGIPFSTDGTYPQVEQFAPLWLERQRLLLELSYHHLSVNLYRPLISFTSLPPPPGSTIEEIIMQCAKHAIMLTKITQHMVAETSLLDGWHEAYYCQWNSALTLVGLLVAYPTTSFVGEARSAIDLALLVFDNYGAKFTVARNAARIVRELCKKIDPVMKHDRFKDKMLSYVNTNLTEGSRDRPQDFLPSQLYSSNPMFESIYPMEEIEISGFDFNMAADIDFWNDLNALWPNINS